MPWDILDYLQLQIWCHICQSYVDTSDTPDYFKWQQQQFCVNYFCPYKIFMLNYFHVVVIFLVPHELKHKYFQILLRQGKSSVLSSPALEMWKLRLGLPCWSTLPLYDDPTLAELHLHHLSCFLCIGSGTGEQAEGNNEHHQKEEWVWRQLCLNFRFPQALPDSESAQPNRCFFGHTPTGWHSFKKRADVHTSWSDYLPTDRGLWSALKALTDLCYQIQIQWLHLFLLPSRLRDVSTGKAERLTLLVNWLW